ncbi:hypothetical protein [Methanolapillus ohkumae]|uniref:DUF7847 domain-containing protein n=1 Tax=Methanolapillus ohkumae TaxID=3028298 RepID=A0AA96V5J5_9EURY|nr:hypothetical protein MsAm2_06920 [Methanosarcinaceae archaeon Am2]
MTESLQETLEKGYFNFKSNLSISMPPLLMMIFIFILSMIYGVVVGYFIYADFANIGSGNITYNYWAFTGVFILFILLLLLVYSFFMAGAIGLSKEAVETGKTKSGNLWGYGKKYFFRIFLASLISTFLSLLALVFYLPLLYEFYKAGTDPMMVFGTPEMMMTTLSNASIYYYAGTILATIYYILLSFVIYFAEYAIVIDNMKTIAGFKKSYHLLKENAISVMWFILAVTLISIFVSVLMLILLYVMTWLLGSFGLYVAEVIILVLTVFLVALVAVWGTRAYMVLTGKTIYEFPSSSPKERETVQ